MDRQRPIFVLTNTLFAIVATLVAATAFWRVYEDIAFVAMVAITVLAGVVIALLGALFRWPSVVVAPVTVLVYFGIGVPLAIPVRAQGNPVPTVDDLRTLAVAAVTSWKQLVTISLPVGSYQALLVPAFILVLLTSVISLSIALRARHGELAVVAPAGLFVAAILLGPTTPTWPVLLGTGLFVIELFWVMWFHWVRRATAIRSLALQSGAGATRGGRADRSTGSLRTLVAAIAILVIAAVGGGATATAVPVLASRQVVRSVVQQPFDPRHYPSPLTKFRSYLEKPTASDDLVTVSGLAPDRRLQIATMDTYDGVVYSVGTSQISSASGSFTRLPYQLEQPSTSGTQAQMMVRIDDYHDVWLPTDGDLEQITFLGSDADRLQNGFYYNDTTGTGAVIGAVRTGDEYQLRTVVQPVRSAAQLQSSEPGTASLPKLGVVPDQLDQTLAKYDAHQSTPGGKLAAALLGLARNGYVSHGIGDEVPSRSGHGADRITELLTDDPMVGDQEQYSVTAALMARQLGFPARVVIGFVAPSNSTSRQVTFTGSDISAWVEIQTKTEGWVTVDPTPPVRAIPPKQPDTPQQISRPQTVVEPPVDTTPKQQDETPNSHVDNDSPLPNPWLAVVLQVLQIGGLVLLALAIIAAPFLAIIVAKLRRRALRRRTGPPLTRISGGWHEFADVALDHGFDLPSTGTRSEAARVVGGGRSLLLASVADRAVFGPVPPGPGEADAVWRAVDQLRHTLGADLTRWQRFRAAVSLRSLGGGARRVSRADRPGSGSGRSTNGRAQSKGSPS